MIPVSFTMSEPDVTVSTLGGSGHKGQKNLSPSGPNKGHHLAARTQHLRASRGNYHWWWAWADWWRTEGFGMCTGNFMWYKNKIIFCLFWFSLRTRSIVGEGSRRTRWLVICTSQEAERNESCCSSHFPFSLSWTPQPVNPVRELLTVRPEGV